MILFIIKTEASCRGWRGHNKETSLLRPRAPYIGLNYWHFTYNWWSLVLKNSPMGRKQQTNIKGVCGRIQSPPHSFLNRVFLIMETNLSRFDFENFSILWTVSVTQELLPSVSLSVLPFNKCGALFLPFACLYFLFFSGVFFFWFQNYYYIKHWQMNNETDYII